MKKQSKKISDDKLRLTVLGLVDFSNKRFAPFSEKISKELHPDSEVPDDETVKTASRITEETTDLIVRKLKDSRTKILFTEKDAVIALSNVAKSIAESDKENVTSENVQQVIEMLSPMVNEILDLNRASTIPLLGEKKFVMKMIRLALKISAAKKVSPDRMFDNQEIQDEFLRKLYSRDEFIARSKAGFDDICNTEFQTKKVLEPILDIFAKNGDDSKTLNMTRESFKEEFLTKLPKIKKFTRDWIKAECQRIYGK